MTTKSNDLATTDSTSSTGFLALRNFDFADAVSEEMDGLKTSFERIKIPSGGTTVFEIPGDDPNATETVKEFSAVILYHHPMYAYYKDAYTGGSNPPDCGSYDGVTGIGIPGGNCNNCSKNLFGTGANGAKACKNRRRIYLLREGEIFPMILSLPTGSLKEFSRYLMRQMSKGNKSNAVVTRFTLKKATNGNGMIYSQAQFAVDRKLTTEEYALVSNLSEQVKAMSRNVEFTSEESINIDPETGEIIEPLD
ncbi:MAG: hypothetical protein RSD01_06700 [Ruthenibacterium sp.]